MKTKKRGEEEEKTHPIEVQGDKCQISLPHASLILMHST
jgi:hypothetical protein